GTTLLFYGGAGAHPELRPIARTSPRRDETVVPLGWHLISFSRLAGRKVYWSCLAKRSSALQACNRMRNSQADGVPRGTGLRRSDPASGAFCVGGNSRSPESCLENAPASLANASCSLPRFRRPPPWHRL